MIHPKPSWDTAPEWANFVCLDENYIWWWCEDKPVAGQWGAEMQFHGQCKKVYPSPMTIEERPE
jgi:hypothetical protein